MESEAANLRDGFFNFSIICFQILVIFALIGAATRNFNCDTALARFDSGLFVGTYSPGARAGDHLPLKPIEGELSFVSCRDMFVRITDLDSQS
jgi:hypothetical protein